jgi:exonuclease SbcC
VRLHRLHLEGFGPFRDRQEVDFDAFADDGIFLIAGRTGAGKSSVLDGVCFGLYGGVPRYDGSEKRIRSDHCAPDDPTSVSIEFTTGGRRWRVTRSPEYERAKKRGSGTTTVAAEAQLDEYVGGAWIGRASGARSVALELDDVLGLSQQQFLQVILLAQNRFAQFLLAKNDERQKLLRRLFGTRTYEDYQVALEDRRRESERALATAGDGVALLLAEADRVLAAAGLAADAGNDSGDDSEEAVGDGSPVASPGSRLEAAERGVQRARYRAESLGHERDAADDAHRRAEAEHARATTLHERQQQRLHSRAALAALEARDEQIARDRQTLAHAQVAEVLRAPIETAERAEAATLAAARAADDAQRRLAAAVDGFDELDLSVSDDDRALQDVVSDLTGRIAVWTAALESERMLEATLRAIAERTSTLAELDASVAEIAGAVADVPARLEALDAELARAQGPADAVDERRGRLSELESMLAAARQAVVHADAARTADEAYLTASATHDAARAAVTGLLQRRLAGFAGELAHRLQPGEPCAVCGSVEHPAPADPADDPVTDEQIAAAEAARDAAAAAETDAAAAARDARQALADARARAGGEDVARLVERRDAAAADAERAMRATETVTRLTEERAQLLALDEAARAERDRLADEQAQVREQLAGARARADQDRRVVDEARGAHAGVADRIAAATRVRDAARTAAESLAAQRTTVAAAIRAREERDELVDASAFDDVAAATAALRDADTRAALDAGIRDHDASLRAERDRLRDLELALAGEPDEPIDLAVPRAALAAARDEWSRAVDAAAEAAQTARTVSDLVDRAHREQEGLAGLAEDHEIIARLANTVAGRAPNTHRMTLESFVLAAELEEIVEAANVRLADMSAGRYRIQHTDALAARGAASGLGLEIMDAHTGAARPAQSLSGGETFLASLALALGLAEVVTARAGGVRLDTLFIDEGFGSLDDDTLDLAMRTLDELRSGGRTVGLISHVAAMKEQIPAQLRVEATPHGPSVIRQGAAIVA